MAVTTRSGPVTSSPPANTPGRVVAPVSWSARCSTRSATAWSARADSRIGRGSEAQIRLDGDLGVSRQHAQIYEQSGVLRVRDLQSTHGTAVNGFSIADKSLDPGDRIRVGLSTLLVKVGS